MRSTMLALLWATAAAPPDDLRVQPGVWGEDDARVRRILRSVIETFEAVAPGLERPPLSVSWQEGDPITLFKRGRDGEVRMRISAKDGYWAQMVFQFAHELVHVLCKTREGPNPNLWFEETLCEAGSLFALRRMAGTWTTSPPFPEARAYAAHLRAYAEERLRRFRLPKDATLAGWFAEHRDTLREEAVDRDLTGAAAASLLPMLEARPARWEAIGALNAGGSLEGLSFRDYLRRWRDAAPQAQRAWIEDAAARFGLRLEG